MNRVVAVALVAALAAPAAAVAGEPSLLPSFEQPVTPALTLLPPSVERPLHERWYFWLSAAGLTATLAFAIGLAVSLVEVGPTPVKPVKRSDFSCNQGGMLCDGYVNPPAQ
jgi:hypothetical protein